MKFEKFILVLSVILYSLLTGFTPIQESNFSSNHFEKHSISSEEDSKNPYTWQYISAESFAYSLTHQENFGFGFLGIKNDSVRLFINSKNGISELFFFTLDKRKLISRYLYPFHFFF